MQARMARPTPPLEKLLKKVPRSKMKYPDTFADKLKYYVWCIYTPFHPLVRDLALLLGIVRHAGRQDFILGKIADEHTVEDFINHVVQQGFGRHYVAWRDHEEIASLRYVENFSFQYHLRIFADREVRGHYEFTPEYKPIKHLYSVGMEDRRDDFYAFVGSLLSH